MFVMKFVLLLWTLMMPHISVAKKILDFCVVRGNGSMTVNQLMPSIQVANNLLADVGLEMNASDEFQEIEVQRLYKKELSKTISNIIE